jgi:hypothetical protein
MVYIAKWCEMAKLKYDGIPTSIDCAMGLWLCRMRDISNA